MHPAVGARLAAASASAADVLAAAGALSHQSDTLSQQVAAFMDRVRAA